MSPLVALVAFNLVVAVVVAVLVVRWRRSAAALAPADATMVAVRVAVDGDDRDLGERCLEAALLRAGFVRDDDGDWNGPGAATARLHPPVVGDAADLLEVSAASGDVVLAEVVGRFLDEGYELRRERGTRLVLARADERVVIALGPS